MADAATGAAARQAAAARITWVSIVVNVLLMAGQIAVGWFAHSQALVADGIHSLSDLIADGVVLLANRRSDAAPDDDHNYGHSRYETVASFFLGSLLLAVGAGMLWRAVQRLTDIDAVPDVHATALMVAAVAIVAKECLFRYMLRLAERVRSSLLIANAWHARSDAASSLVVALGIVGSLFGYKVLDPIAACIVGFMVGRMGWTFAWNAVQDLSDRALDREDAERMQTLLLATPGVRGVHDVKTRKMGDNALVDAHLLVDPRISVSEGHYIAESARARLKENARVLDAMIHIDPERDDVTAFMPFDLPLRPAMLQKVSAAFGALGIPVENIDLHYLENAVELDVYVPVATLLPVTHPAGTSEAAEAAESAAPIRLTLQAVTNSPSDWEKFDSIAMARYLGVRRLNVYLALPGNTHHARKPMP